MASIKEELDYPKIWTSNSSKQLQYSKKREKFDETITWGRSSKDFNDFFESILVGNINNKGGEIYLYELTDHIHYSPVSSKPHITITLNDDSNSKIRYYFNNPSNPIQIDNFGYARVLQGQIGIIIKLHSIFEKIITSSNFKTMAELYIDTGKGNKTKRKKRKRSKTKHKKRKRSKTKHKKIKQNKTKHKKRKHKKQ